MNLKKALLLFGAVLVFVSFAASSAKAQYLAIGVGIPVYRPIPYYGLSARPYYPYRYRAYAPVPVAPLRVYVAMPPAYYPQPAPVLQAQYYGYPAPSAPEPRMSASPITDTLATPIPPPPPQPPQPVLPTAPPATPMQPTAPALAPPALITPPLATPMPQSIPALPDQTTGTEF